MELNLHSVKTTEGALALHTAILACIFKYRKACVSVEPDGRILIIPPDAVNIDWEVVAQFNNMPIVTEEDLLKDRIIQLLQEGKSEEEIAQILTEGNDVSNM